MRIRVADVLEMLAEGVSADEMLSDFPDLEAEDIQTCLLFAARAPTSRGWRRDLVARCPAAGLGRLRTRLLGRRAAWNHAGPDSGVNLCGPAFGGLPFAHSW